MSAFHKLYTFPSLVNKFTFRQSITWACDFCATTQFAIYFNMDIHDSRIAKFGPVRQFFLFICVEFQVAFNFLRLCAFALYCN